LKLKHLLALEIVAIALVTIAITLVIEISPYLISSKQSDSIDVYSQKLFASGVATLSMGENLSSQFNYSTYDPAILSVDISFQNWEKQGYLLAYCNGRLMAKIEATPANVDVHLTTISVSGSDWVKTPPLNSTAYLNKVTFSSPSGEGYTGTFSYQISIRGSR
jgi:hypothetical protein